MSGPRVPLLFTCEVCRQQRRQSEMVEIPTRPGRAMRACKDCEGAAQRYVAARFPARKVAA